MCCSIWSIWHCKNKRLHERKWFTSKETTLWVHQYLKEIRGEGLKKNTCVETSVSWVPPSSSDLKINFDASLDSHQGVSCSGVLVRNSHGKILVAQTTLHQGVGTPFTAKPLACRQAVRLGTQLDLAIIEEDARSVIKKMLI